MNADRGRPDQQQHLWGGPGWDGHGGSAGHAHALTGIALTTGEDGPVTPSGLFARAREGSSGNVGALQVKAGTVLVRDGAQISSSTSGAGQDCTVTVMARDTLTLTGQSSQGDRQWVFQQCPGRDGGRMVVVRAPRIEMGGQPDSRLIAAPPRVARRGASR